MKIVPNTIIEQPPAISDKRSAARSGNRSFHLIDISAEIPYIQAYNIPKITNMEPTAIRNTPAIAIDLLFNTLTSSRMIYYFKLY